MSTSNTTTVEDVERFDTDELIHFLQTKNFGLKKKEYKIFRRERVNGRQFLHLTREKLLADPYKFPGGPTEDLANLIIELNKQSRFNHKNSLILLSFKAFIFVVTKAIF
ncbi:10719_t:CDS:1 [Funneliformis caledonium]|uniref:10719_t:CDS:1 n=1 Tax=Funneliformis caledonium TaxID=1117310 RepID=A0A9N9BUI5_9GLOM|nr:10719_t:CDS:1 [Funneliformis caledonium]